MATEQHDPDSPRQSAAEEQETAPPGRHAAAKQEADRLGRHAAAKQETDRLGRHAAAEKDPAHPEDPSDADGTGEHEDEEEFVSPFPHPPWTVGLVLVAGVITLLFGLLVNPIWLMVGSPFVVALGLWLYVRLVVGPDALD